MIKFGTELANMQSEIDKINSGYCLLVKLINYEELGIVIRSLAGIVNDLNNIIRKICNNFAMTVYTQIEYNNVIIVLPKIDEELLKSFVFQIYTESQFYINKDIPEAYMNCQIASIDFPNTSNSSEVLYSLLTGVLTHFKTPGYYTKYDNNLHDLKFIKSYNKELNQLRIALINKTMQFAYQPIIDRKTGNIYYHECLLRIPNDDNDLISVGTIIPKAESTGLINLIDYQVFAMVVNELVNTPDIILSVNISNIGILDDHLLDVAKQTLAKHQVSKRLIIEITETSLNEDYVKTKFFIDSLHKLGCRFALDDFGSGFTSFKQLQNLPIDIVKIDGNYVRNLTSNHHNKYFIEALVKISEDLGIKTVAEFVENGEVAKFLIDIKIDAMQGNFFSPASSNRNS